MVLVRELPRLTHTVEVEAPTGRLYRWAGDEPNPANVFSGLQWSSTMPGGWENHDCVLSRKSGHDYADLAPLSTIRVRDAAGSIVGEYRLERVPRVSGERMSVSPVAVGWQAALADNKAARGVYIDRDLARWGAPSSTRKADRINNNWKYHSAGAAPDETNALPALRLEISDAWASPYMPRAELVYDAGPGNLIALVYYDAAFTNSGGSWNGYVGVSPDDTLAVQENTANLAAAAAASGYFDPATDRRYAWVMYYNAATPGGTAGSTAAAAFRKLAAYGPHGLTRYGAAPGGLLCSDIEAHIVTQWAPRLAFTTGPGGTIQPSSFVIPHLAFHDPTTAAEMIKQATRFELRDWAVWEGPTYYSNAFGARGRSWRARVGPAGLEETGPQVDRIWESIVVQYRDVDGSTRTVGPPGSGADVESSALQDSDRENPANQAGIPRRDLLQIGTATPAIATEVGQAFLEAAKRLSTAGRARLVGHVEDDRGILHPYSHVRAGDDITFIDASDPSPRRIVKAENNHAERSVSIDLDSPPEGLQAALERFGARLTVLGV